ncbi:MAG TPA: NAD(P)H-hydrate dehydratase [Marinilabiliaceae bacterium]|nr:NAD(P)H-hydrate dehydratase [Marinilabiliaceae bacterium]
MIFFPVKTIFELDAYTIDHEPILSINLMERAARKMYEYIHTHYQGRSFLVLAGPGNNGGDALALSRVMLLGGYDVTVVLLKSEGLSPDTQINRNRLNYLEHAVVVSLDRGHPLPTPDPETIIIDGLFGIGLNRPLEKEALSLVQIVNKWPNQVISIDIPSGLMGEDNSSNNADGVIESDLILTLQFPKLSFFFPENQRFIDRWEVLPIGLHEGKISETESLWSFTDLADVKNKLPSRNKFTHKNQIGHALLIAGSYGMMGAAVLASRACMKSGVGLLTAHVPCNSSHILHIAVPEVLVSIDRSELMFTEHPNLEKFDAVGIGPGMGVNTNSIRAFTHLLDHIENRPLVVDADALNILSTHPELLDKLPENTILTPHPGEFKRLVGSWEGDYHRMHKAVEFCKLFKVIVVLKGAFTTVVLPDGHCHFNSTGNAGMATAGCGDALTGVILALLGRGLKPDDAALLGVYLHGLAGDLAAGKCGQDSLITSDLIDCLGDGFRLLQ